MIKSIDEEDIDKMLDSIDEQIKKDIKGEWFYAKYIQLQSEQKTYYLHHRISTNFSITFFKLSGTRKRAKRRYYCRTAWDSYKKNKNFKWIW